MTQELVGAQGLPQEIKKVLLPEHPDQQRGDHHHGDPQRGDQPRVVDHQKPHQISAGRQILHISCGQLNLRQLSGHNEVKMLVMKGA